MAVKSYMKLLEDGYFRRKIEITVKKFTEAAKSFRALVLQLFELILEMIEKLNKHTFEK